MVELFEPGADLGFSREEGGQIFKNFVDLFLGRPNRFFELSSSTKKTLFWPNFLRRLWALFGKF